MRDNVQYMSCFYWLINLAEIVLNLKIAFGRMAAFIILIPQVNLWALLVFLVLVSFLVYFQ